VIASPGHFANDSTLYQICMPSLVVLFDCPAEVAKSRFLARKREDGDNEAMFAKRYAEFETNNQMIMERYAKIAKLVSGDCTL
jgi:thymidylate kinase